MQRFIHGFRLGLGVERVKGKVKFILRESGKVRIHWGKRGKTKEGKGEQGEEGKRGKTRLAKRYLGLQGTWHEREGMGKGEGTLSGRKELEGDFRRNGNSSVNSAV